MTNEDLILEYRNGRNSLLETILMDNEGLIRLALKKIYIRDPAIDRDDLMQEGYIALIKAIHGYDINGQTAFSTYAYKVIWGSLYRLVSGRNYRKGYDGIKEVSLNTPISGQDGELELGDTLTCDEYGYDEINNRLSNKSLIDEAVEVLETLEFLDTRSVDIIKHKYGIGTQSLNNQELANKYKITTERIRQIEVRALRSLRASKWGIRINDERITMAKNTSYGLGVITGALLNVMDGKMKYEKKIQGTGLSIDFDVLKSIYD